MSDKRQPSKQAATRKMYRRRDPNQVTLPSIDLKGDGNSSNAFHAKEDDSKYLTAPVDSDFSGSRTSTNKDSSLPKISRKRKVHEPTKVDATVTKKGRSMSSDSDQDDQRSSTPTTDKTISTKANDPCPICLDTINEPKSLNRCGHVFCRQCIDYYFETVKPQCPCCATIYGEIRGNQPSNGIMNVEKTRHRLPGFENNSTGTIRISYYFPDGVQDESHPNPGQPYHGTTRHAYLPENNEGREILKLLQRAFALRQIFTIGQSRTTGYDNVITWNDIHHKTSYHGGIENFGYPDPTYLNRVRLELAAKGIL